MAYGFGDWLRAKREAKGLSQAALGRGLGTGGVNVSKSVVYGWEKEQHYPRVDQLYMMCTTLGCTADALMFGIEHQGSFSKEAADVARAIDTFQGDTRERVIQLCRQAIELARPSSESGNPSRSNTNY
jgi:Predicted transcriptional regulators